MNGLVYSMNWGLWEILRLIFHRINAKDVIIFVVFVVQAWKPENKFLPGQSIRVAHSKT